MAWVKEEEDFQDVINHRLTIFPDRINGWLWEWKGKCSCGWEPLWTHSWPHIVAGEFQKHLGWIPNSELTSAELEKLDAKNV